MSKRVRLAAIPSTVHDELNILWRQCSELTWANIISSTSLGLRPRPAKVSSRWSISASSRASPIARFASSSALRPPCSMSISCSGAAVGREKIASPALREGRIDCVIRSWSRGPRRVARKFLSTSAPRIRQRVPRSTRSTAVRPHRLAMSVAFVDQGGDGAGPRDDDQRSFRFCAFEFPGPEQFQESCPFGGVEGSAEPGEVQVSGLERAECGHSFPGPGEEAFEPELRECVRSFEGEDHVWGRARKKNRIIVHGGSRTARCSFRRATICGISRNLANLGVAPEMADEEHPEGTGGGGGQEPSRKGKTRQDEPPPSDPGQVEAVSAAAARAPAPQAAAHPGTSAPGGSSAEYVPPPPAGASADSSGERGISGALALWGPLIIIGFLVLVLNTEDAPQGRPARRGTGRTSRGSARGDGRVAVRPPANAVPDRPGAGGVRRRGR